MKEILKSILLIMQRQSKLDLGKKILIFSFMTHTPTYMPIENKIFGHPKGQNPLIDTQRETKIEERRVMDRGRWIMW